MCKVSIIIPVYNTQDYLKDCLESCVNQTMQDIEIIAVDDASTDCSRKMLEEYKVRYTNKLIYKTLDANRGPGQCRNIGIKLSTGKYIYFLDSDDILELNACELLYKEAEKENAEIVFCDSYFRKDENISFYSNFYFYGQLRTLLLLLMDVSPCGKLIRADLIKNNELFFPNNRFFYEDTATTPLWTLLANRYAKVDKPLWTYVQRKESTTHNTKDQDIELHCLKAIDILVKRTKELGIYDKNKNEIQMYALARILDTYNRITQKYDMLQIRCLDALKSALVKYLHEYNNNLDSIYMHFFQPDEVSVLHAILSDNLWRDSTDVIPTQMLLEKYKYDSLEEYYDIHKKSLNKMMNEIEKRNVKDVALWGAGRHEQILFKNIFRQGHTLKVIDPGKRMQKIILEDGNHAESPELLGRDYNLLLVTNNMIHPRIKQIFLNTPIINVYEMIKYKIDIKDVLDNILV